MLERIPHIAGTHLPHQVDDIAAGGDTVVEPEVLDGIDLEGRVFIPVSDRRMIPELTPALASFLRSEPVALKIGPDGNAFGLCDVHRLNCYTDKRGWVREGEAD